MGLRSMFQSKKTSIPIENTWDAPDASFFVLTDEQAVALQNMPKDEDGFVLLGDVTRNLLNQQTQYISFHFDGSTDYPVLTNGLRTDISGISYHAFKIHADDVTTFLARLRACRRAKGLPCK